MPEPITTPEQAILRVHLLTGLSIVAGPPVPTLVKIDDDVTPFLGEGNIGKQAWQVEYPRASLKFASARPGSVDRYRRTFIAMLEASTGRLFYVTSTYEGEPDPHMRPMPSCGVATEQLTLEKEVYAGYPAEDPKFTFFAALESIQTSGFGSPYLAKEIHGAYVKHSYMGSKAKPAWVITLRGLPPFAGHGPDPSSIPVWQRNHMRDVVDAMTGKVLFATNSPQPV